MRTYTKREGGMTRRDYERLSDEVKRKTALMLQSIKANLRKHTFSLEFLEHSGRWDDLTPWKFLEKPEDHYRRLIAGAKWVRPQPREEMLDQITELYSFVRTSKQGKATGLDYWL
jgi:hypothetical protein